MTTSPTDYRALCAELVDALDKCQRPYGDEPESSLVWKARAALAQPEPQEPTDAEIEQFADNAGFIEGHAYDACGFRIHDEVGFARAVLARWGK